MYLCALINIEAMIEYLQHMDSDLLLWLNGFHNSFFDSLMWLISYKYVWIPMYAVLLYVLFKKYGIHVVLFVLIAMFLLNFAVSDYVCGSVLRHAVMRPRPTNVESPIWQLVHTVNDYRGGHYGFPSCHAANSFSLATLMSLQLRKIRIIIFIFTWAIFHSYSRIYLGVHYPGDIVAGALIGVLIAFAIYYAFNYVAHIKYDRSTDYINMIPYAGLSTLVTLILFTYIKRQWF